MTVCYGIISCSGAYDYWIILALLAAIILSVYIFTNSKWSLAILFAGWIALSFILQNFFEFIFFEKPISSIMNILYVSFIAALTYLPILKVKENRNKHLTVIWIIAVIIVVVLIFFMRMGK